MMKLSFQLPSRSLLAACALALTLTQPIAVLAQPTPSNGPACERAIPEMLPAGNLNLAVSIAPDTVWQPRNGEVQFTIQGATASLAIDAVVVCFRWRGIPDARWIRSPSLRLVANNMAGAATFAATVPGELDETEVPNWFARVTEYSRDGDFTGIDMVPLADVRVMAESAAGPLDLILPVGITSRYFAFFAAVFLVAIAWVVLYFFGRQRCVPGGRDPVLTVIAARDGYASLSTLQIIMWSFVVGASAVYVMMLSGNLIEITEGTLVLLGISGIATLGNKLRTTMVKLEEPPSTAPPPPPPPPPSGPECVPLTSRKPMWSDLVVDHFDGEIEPSRVQMLFFTVIVALFVGLRVVTSGRIPDIPIGYLALMGISNGVYLTAKFMPERRTKVEAEK